MRDIFVFGSNLSGIHGAGAALFAKKHHGAIQGVGRGLTGNSYALPTKGYKIETLTLAEVELYIREFIIFAQDHPELRFNLTPVGCGLAGFTKSEIGGIFRKYGLPDNVFLTRQWLTD